MMIKLFAEMNKQDFYITGLNMLLLIIIIVATGCTSVNNNVDKAQNNQLIVDSIENEMRNHTWKCLGIENFDDYKDFDFFLLYIDINLEKRGIFYSLIKQNNKIYSYAKMID